MPRRVNWLQVQKRVSWRGTQTPHEERRDFQFATKWSEIEDSLYREIHKLGSEEAIIALDVRNESIRLDGGLRGNAAPESPGVQFYFKCRHGSLVYQCDRFKHWVDNIRAIALTLERLRLAELYGACVNGAQYTGFKALPGPGADPSQNGRVFMGKEDAIDWILSHEKVQEKFLDIPSLEEVLGDRLKFDRIYRVAVKVLHPDTGGAHEDFVKLQEAKKTIEEGW